MKTYDFGNYDRVMFVGTLNDDEASFSNQILRSFSVMPEIPVHPKELERQERLSKRRGKRSILSSLGIKATPRGNGIFDNTIIFSCGGIGLGSKDDSFTEDILRRLDESLQKNNSHLVIVRGCDDNPIYFTEGNPISASLKNVILAEDYSIVKMSGFNCLCVGGGVPIDRQWRMEQGSRIGKTLYFEKSESTLNKEALDEILSNNDIACVFTTDAPTFVPPSMDTSNKSKWASNDKDIMKELTAQRLVMDKIYIEFINKDKKPRIWCYSSNYGDCTHNNGIKYISTASVCDFYDLQSSSLETFGTFLDGKKSMPKKPTTKFKKMASDFDSAFATRPAYINPVRAVNEYEATIDPVETLYEMPVVDVAAEPTEPVRNVRIDYNQIANRIREMEARGEDDFARMLQERVGQLQRERADEAVGTIGIGHPTPQWYIDTDMFNDDAEIGTTVHE